MQVPSRRNAVTIVAVVMALALPAAVTPRESAEAAEPGFSVTTVWSGFTEPTAISLTDTGLVFVAQKNGIVRAFNGLRDTTAVQTLNISTQVHNFWDRGLLGMTVDPAFGSAGHNYLYLLYTYDAPPGRAAPVWNDACPGPPNGPGATTDGCVVQGKLTRTPIDPSTGVANGPEQVLIGPAWCQQYPSHSVGDLAFGADGALYVTAGDGSSFDYVDYGQSGGTIINSATGKPYTPANPCGDPPGSVGTANTSPTGRGGSLRSQSVRRPAGEAVLLNGAVLRVDPATGEALPDNPLASSTRPNARRIVGYGLRNPFRMTVRPGTNEIWVGDVGWRTWEEINRIAAPTSAAVNFGWPCYEGNGRQSGYDSLNQCTALYADTANPARSPWLTYNHGATFGSGDTCRTGGSSITGLAFYEGTSYPSKYQGALFFGDHGRSCVWVMFPGTNGLPDPSTTQTVVDDSANPEVVDIETDPLSGDVVYADLGSGTIHRISYTAGNTPPTAAATATSPTSGDAPLTVSFDGRGSRDPDGDALAYSWDLNGDRTYGDATTPTASRTYSTPGTYPVSLRVSDGRGGSDVSRDIVVTVGNTPPAPAIDSPTTSLRWSVDQTVTFSGRAPDTQDGALGGSAMQWSLVMHHCPSNCHAHEIGVVGTGRSGSFVAPDHSYPSWLELRLTATDSGGLSAATSVRLDPRTVVLTFATKPGGLSLTVNGAAETATFTRTVIVGSANTVSAPSSQQRSRTSYRFVSWSDGGAADHTVRAPATATTYTARYRRG